MAFVTHPDRMILCLCILRFYWKLLISLQIFLKVGRCCTNKFLSLIFFILNLHVILYFSLDLNSYLILWTVHTYTSAYYIIVGSEVRKLLRGESISHLYLIHPYVFFCGGPWRRYSQGKVKTLKTLLNISDRLIYLLAFYQRHYIAADYLPRLRKLNLRKQTPFEMNQA